MKKVYVLLMAVLLCAMMLSACGGGASGSPAVSENPLLIPPVNASRPDTSSLAGGAGSATVPPLCSGAQDTNTAAYATEVVRLINVQRSNYNLTNLATQTNIRNAAQKHTIDMACHFFVSHTGSDNSLLEDRLDSFGYFWLVAGENIAAGYSTPSAVVTAWMNSTAGHRENILDPEYTEIGVGYVYNPNDTTRQYHYWTLDLGTR